MTLLKDIYSTGKKKYLIAKVGDRVSLVAEHGEVLIVQKDLRRFSVKRENVNAQ